jgi:formylglycine-generating enzyme required for sulfatase activity
MRLMRGNSWALRKISSDGFSWGDVEPGDARGSPAANVNSGRGAVAVGSFPPNGYGLHDMVGNVWEFCSDWYDKTYYPTSPKRNPQGPNTGMYKVVRGGSWTDDDERVFMNHFRNFTDPTLRASSIGFRCATSGN